MWNPWSFFWVKGRQRAVATRAEWRVYFESFFAQQSSRSCVLVCVIPTVPTENSTASAPAPATSIRPLRILYADDMLELRMLMQDALAREGHTIETAGDGDEALERLREARSGFDLVITDHHMPGINGLELVRQARALPYPGKIAVFS